MASKKQINEFLSDPDYLELIELEREQRLLFITDISETRVSAFLAWVFRPFEGHGLNERPMRELLLNAWRNADTAQTAIAPRDLLRLSFSDVLVNVEYQLTEVAGSGRGRSVDLLLVSRQNKLVVAIENKFGSRAHSNQLSVYRQAVEQRFQNWKCIFIYLDSNAVNEPDDPAWIKMDYSWLVGLIASQERSGLLSDQALHALKQVREYLTDGVATSSESPTKRDQKIEGLLLKHKAVLDVFASLMKEDWRAQIQGPDLGNWEPLLVELHQRWRLWSDVLAQSHHVAVVAAARRSFGDQVEISASPAGVHFRLKEWRELEADSSGVWGPQVWAWSGREGQTYSVGSGVQFSNIRADREEALRVLSAQLRSATMKAAPRNASWMRFGRVSEQTAEQAGLKVVSELQRLSKSFAVKGRNV